ncbi:MAG: glycoside hydrolase family 18 protein [Chloroflexi bacterium]|nr:glycoside hydrolase family 18 protein [Chloroflexota bacterium]
MTIRPTLRTTAAGLALAVTLIAVLAAPVLDAAAQGPASPYRVVGYYPGYGIYEDYFVTDIPADHLTHVIYASLMISDNGQCVSSDPWTDMQVAYPGDQANLRLKGNFRQLQLLRGEHPNLKVLISVGGWEHSANFSEVAASEAARVRFVRSCVAFMQQYLFDGIDIDWRYPVSGGQVEGLPEDRENFNLLLAEFRTQLDAAGERDDKPYLLTMLAPAVPELYENFDLARAQTSLDWINLATYGFHGAWSDIASHHAPLYANERDPRGEEIQDTYNVAAVVEVFLDAGVPADKLVVGAPLYAQAWSNVKPNDYFGLYERTSGVPLGTRPGGQLYYRDLLPLLENPGYTQFFDEETGVPWLYSADERIAISYENEQSIRGKAMYIRRNELGGLMLWQISYDAPDGSLIEAAYEALNEVE